MDCDARRKMLVTDLDGSLLGKALTTFVSKSEWHWIGVEGSTDRRWGLGKIAKRFFLTGMVQELTHL